MSDQVEIIKAMPWTGLKGIASGSCDLVVLDLCTGAYGRVAGHDAGIALGLAHACAPAARIAIVWDPGEGLAAAGALALERYIRAFTGFGFSSVGGTSPVSVRIGAAYGELSRLVMTGLTRTGDPRCRVLAWLLRSFTLEGDRVLFPWVADPDRAFSVLRQGRKLVVFEGDKRAFRSLLMRVDDVRPGAIA